MFCTGSLLAPNLVLTAQHCTAEIGDGSSEDAHCATDQFGAPFPLTSMVVSTNAQPQMSRGALYPVERVVGAPGTRSVCGFDVALLILRGAGVPSSEATPLVPRLDVDTRALTAFSAVGFGLQDPHDEAGATVGNRMRSDNGEVECIGANCPVQEQVQADEWYGKSPICPGDSGGPALDSLGRVFGVTSHGDLDCTHSVYSNVADWADFLRTAAREAATEGGYVAPAWAQQAELDAGAPSAATGATTVERTASASDGCAMGGAPRKRSGPLVLRALIALACLTLRRTRARS